MENAERREQKFHERKEVRAAGASAAEQEQEEASAVLQLLSMEGHPGAYETGERCWRRKEPFTEPFPEARNCRTSNTRDLPARSEWPEEPEAYEGGFPSRRIRGRWGKRFKWTTTKELLSTSFQPLISSHLTNRKIQSKEKKNIVRQNIHYFGRNLYKASTHQGDSGAGGNGYSVAKYEVKPAVGVPGQPYL